MKPALPILAALFLLQPAAAALAGDWQLVLSDRNRRVEIDRASIFTSDRGTKVSWGRVVLTNDEAAAAGYRTIKALNRYDCRSRTFVTIKRVYLDASENLLREEALADEVPVTVAPASVDERMWREVCNPPSAADLQKVAGEAARLAAAQTAAEPPARPEPIRARDVDATPMRIAAPPVAEAGAAPAQQAAAASIVPPLPRIVPPKAAETPPAVPPAASPTPPAANPVSPGRSVPAAGVAVRQAPPPPVAGAEVRPAAPRKAEPRRVAAPSRPAVQPAAAAAVRSVRPGDDGWRYDGDAGPQAWGELRPDWRLCSEGTRQSPVDLRDGIAVDLEPVRFDYRATGFRIRDTGNTLQVEVGAGMGIEVRGKRYALERFTLHRPSQDRVGGMAYDMALYLEHRSEDGQVAILSRLLAAGGDASALLQTLWNNLPLDRGREFAPAATIDLAALVPADPGHYLYLGSLPVPPCTEDVLWVVMKEPLPISDEQLAVFARLYPRTGRPIQPANGRLILESR